MKFLNRIARSIIYHLTVKPSCYVHVEKPRTLQDHRQIQYNNWCRGKCVYSGSYLPKNPTTLNRKGWIDITSSMNKSGIKHFMRKSSGQVVRFDPENNFQINHYHWSNPLPTKSSHKLLTKYLDRYGLPCTKRDDRHHLAPLDKNCPKGAYKK